MHSEASPWDAMNEFSILMTENALRSAITIIFINVLNLAKHQKERVELKKIEKWKEKVQLFCSQR